MKNYLILVFLFSFSIMNAQEEEKSTISGNNELKLNMAYAIAGFPEITYERVLDEGGAVGLSLAISVDEDIDYNVIAVPFYRLYFGKKRAAGFFIEGNVALFSEDKNDGSGDSALGFGPGLAVGGKFLTRSGWVAEIMAGAGRNFLNENQISDVFPRVGVSIGKRF
ncbi:MAG: DUF3575 domain-containing protein [Bacteroidota bacterium]